MGWWMYESEQRTRIRTKNKNIYVFKGSYINDVLSQDYIYI